MNSKELKSRIERLKQIYLEALKEKEDAEKNQIPAAWNLGRVSGLNTALIWLDQESFLIEVENGQSKTDD